MYRVQGSHKYIYVILGAFVPTRPPLLRPTDTTRVRPWARVGCHLPGGRAQFWGRLRPHRAIVGLVEAGRGQLRDKATVRLPEALEHVLAGVGLVGQFLLDILFKGRFDPGRLG